MSESWLIRARLRRDASAAALAPLLVPSDAGARVGAAHRLIWSLLTDGPERRRDFLWRESGSGAWIALAARPPRADPDLFEVQSKPFAPALRPGQRLGFNLRANPVRAAAPAARGTRGKRVDVVTLALRGVAPQDRPAARDQAVRAWLERQGERGGFTPDPARLRVAAEDWVTIPRARDATISFCAVTIEGVLVVNDPPRFLARLHTGFGAARAHGCGLMLIRPAAAEPSSAADDADDLA